MTIARLPSVYLLLGASRIDGEAIPGSWKNVAMLGGMRGALSIALATSLPASIPSRDLITSMVLGVAFLSITLQGFLLSRYISQKFPKRVPMRGVQTLLTLKTDKIFACAKPSSTTKRGPLLRIESIVRSS